tara:strand:- start:129 stop:446 length:318 start_codon:yes stop_codon:yes gene_type:complete
MVLQKKGGGYDMRSKGAKNAKAADTAQGCWVIILFFLSLLTWGAIASVREMFSSDSFDLMLEPLFWICSIATIILGYILIIKRDGDAIGLVALGGIIYLIYLWIF